MNPPYDPQKNYCGPEGHFSFPRYVYGVDCNYAFYLHDIDYRRGGTQTDVLNDTLGTSLARENADVAMYQLMMFYVRQRYRWYDPRRVLAWRRCRKYFLAVRAAGWAFFNKEGGKA